MTFRLNYFVPKGVFMGLPRGLETVVARPTLIIGHNMFSMDISRQKCLRRWIITFYRFRFGTEYFQDGVSRGWHVKWKKEFVLE